MSEGIMFERTWCDNCQLLTFGPECSGCQRKALARKAFEAGFAEGYGVGRCEADFLPKGQTMTFERWWEAE